MTTRTGKRTKEKEEKLDGLEKGEREEVTEEDAFTDNRDRKRAKKTPDEKRQNKAKDDDIWRTRG